MNLFGFFFGRKAKARKASGSSKAPAARARHGRPLELEALEDRCLPTASAISGYVFYDPSNTGIMTLSDPPLANSNIALVNANSVVVGTATTDSNGYYQFNQDATISTAPLTITKTFTIANHLTDITAAGFIGQFDTSLGSLQSVQITNAGSITSSIQVENTSSTSLSTINATVSGHLTLTGPNNFSLLTNVSQNAGTFNASIYDNKLDFAGTSGKNFGSNTANGSQAITLTGAAMAPFEGTGNVSFVENGVATSSAHGGGNLVANIVSSGAAQVTVVYTYTPDNSLAAGSYTIVQLTQPVGYVPGKVSSNGVVLNTPPSVRVIPVTVVPAQTNYPNNNFAELQVSSLSGYVYADISSQGYNDGNMDFGESGIQNVKLTLDGVAATGSVHQATQTDANGYYAFTNLLPGSYTITETSPADYVDGKDTIGSPGGGTLQDQFSNINLPSGYNGTNNNFGELQTSSLGGSVYVDVSPTGTNNGVHDASEAGIAGVAVQLQGTNYAGTTVSLSTTTDSNGNYQFANLQPGTYTVVASQPSGYVDGKDTPGAYGGQVTQQTTQNLIAGINLPAGVTATNYNFGELLFSSLSGSVYVDVSPTGTNNGVRDAGEAGIGGIAMQLNGSTTAGVPVTMTTTTDSNGNYQFANLQSGTYTVVASQPSGYIDGQDTPGVYGGQVSQQATQNSIAGLVLPIAVTATNYNFGELLFSSLSGSVYVDVSPTGTNNGVRDAGEAGINGVAVQLNGSTYAGVPVTMNTTTDNSGNYQFANLQPGTYTVVASQPSGYIDGKDTPGAYGGQVSQQATQNSIGGVVLPFGAAATNYNFGELLASTLSGSVYVDVSPTGFNNGVRDAGEAGISGVAVQLNGSTLAGVPVTMTTTTDNNGNYQFANLQPGTYTVVANQPSGYIDGKDTPGAYGGTVIQQTTQNLIAGINLPAGVAASNYNFGELLASNLSGSVYVDVSPMGTNNGVRDASEAGISGVTVQLNGSTTAGVPVTMTTTTDNNGNYQFSNLQPGTYSVVASQPSGYIDGKDTPGAYGGQVTQQTTQNLIAGINLPAGVAASNYNFGELPASNLSGSVYVDVSPMGTNNGVRDASEAGISGVTVQLNGSTTVGVPVTMTTSTDNNGNYQFSNLQPGTYTVVANQPSGYIDGKDTPGAYGGQVSQQATLNLIAGINLPAGVTAANYNFGELLASNLSGSVYVDVSPTGTNNGVRDAGEAGISGVAVQLNGSTNVGVPVTMTTTTDSNGNYQFANLQPGTYTVVAAQPSGYIDGQDTPGVYGGQVSQQVTQNLIAGVVLPFGVTAANYNFGELLMSSLSGSVYVDVSPTGTNNGLRDPGETGISGVAMQLNGSTYAGAAVAMTTTTDNNGNYQFSNLQPGTYTVVASQPSRFVDGQDTPGAFGGQVSQQATQNSIAGVVLPFGVTATKYNFGELLLSSLSGSVYVDVSTTGSNNGLREAGETGIAGVLVQLNGTTNAGTAVTLTTTTDNNGNYQFSSLQPGTYTVVASQPLAYLDGKDTPGAYGGQVSQQPTQNSIAGIVLPAAAAAPNYNFGELLPGALSGYVYLDTSTGGYNNGNKDPGEGAVAGVTVTLTGSDDQGPVTQSTKTNVNGYYSFTGLRAGTYTLILTQAAGLLAGKNTPGSLGGQASPPHSLINIQLAWHGNGTNYNFGQLTPVISSTPPITNPMVNLPLLVYAPNPTVPAIPIVSKAQLTSGGSQWFITTGKYVNAIYHVILNRDVQTAELSSWLVYLRSGGTRQQMVNTVWNSFEHRYNEVLALYQAIVGTPPSQAVINAVIIPNAKQMINGLSELAVVSSIAAANNKVINPTAWSTLVANAITVLLNRPAGANEIQSWAGYLQSGGSLGTMIAAFLTSPQFDSYIGA